MILHIFCWTWKRWAGAFLEISTHWLGFMVIEDTQYSPLTFTWGHILDHTYASISLTQKPTFGRLWLPKAINRLTGGMMGQCESSRFSHSPFPRRLCKGILGRFKPQLEALWVFSIREASPSSSRHRGGSSEPARGLLLPWTGSGSPLMVQQSFLYTGKADNPFRLLQIPVVTACACISHSIYTTNIHWVASVNRLWQVLGILM